MDGFTLRIIWFVLTIVVILICLLVLAGSRNRGLAVLSERNLIFHGWILCAAAAIGITFASGSLDLSQFGVFTMSAGLFSLLSERVNPLVALVLVLFFGAAVGTLIGICASVIRKHTRLICGAASLAIGFLLNRFGSAMQVVTPKLHTIKFLRVTNTSSGILLVTMIIFVLAAYVISKETADPKGKECEALSASPKTKIMIGILAGMLTAFSGVIFVMNKTVLMKAALLGNDGIPYGMVSLAIAAAAGALIVNQENRMSGILIGFLTITLCSFLDSMLNNSIFRHGGFNSNILPIIGLIFVAISILINLKFKKQRPKEKEKLKEV